MVTSHTSKAFSLAPLINYLDNKKKLRNFYIFINLEIIDYQNKYILSPQKVNGWDVKISIRAIICTFDPKINGSI